jgi:hypothetical protein
MRLRQYLTEAVEYWVTNGEYHPISKAWYSGTPKQWGKGAGGERPYSTFAAAYKKAKQFNSQNRRKGLPEEYYVAVYNQGELERIEK